MRNLCWVAVGLLAACAHSSFLPLDVKALPSASKYPKDHQVILVDEQRIRFGADPKTGEAFADEEIHTQSRLLRGRMPEAANFSYSRTFSKITSLEARVVLPDGTSHDADPSKQRDIAAVGSWMLFSDQRVVSLETPEVPIGGVRETRVVERYSDVRPWIFDFTFGDTEPTELARLTIEYPSGWEIDLVVPEQIQRREETVEGMKRVILEATEIPGFREELQGLPAARALPRAFVRLKAWDAPSGRQHAFEDDKAMSAWLHQKYAALDTPSAELKKTVSEALQGSSAEPRERARRLYEYVSKNVEYCAIEIGYGGWIPHSPAEVHKVRYGDCKDKANYLHALLAEAGIPSQVALVDSHRGFPRELVLPSLGGTFNHAILAVKLPDGEVFADPTERTVPFGLLPARDCESPALELSAEGEKLTRTPSFGPERNSELQRFVLQLDTEGNATGTFSLTGAGVDASELKFQLLRGATKQAELLEKWLDLKALHVTSVTTTELPEFEDRSHLEGQITAERLIARSGNALTLIRLDEFAPRWLPSITDTHRKTPFAYRWLSTLTGEFELTLPKGARASMVPAAVALDNAFFHYELKWKNEAGKVSVHRQLVRKLRVIPVEQFEQFHAAVDEVHVAESRAAVVRFDEGAK